MSATILLTQVQAQADTVSNLTFRVMAANLTGDAQTYEASQIRILQGLKPDIAVMQEFKYLGNSTADIRALVDTAFGTGFYYYRESGYSIPNGIVSRWPIVASGSWPDALVPDRGFAWAQIDLPGSNDLYVVSVHLYASGSDAERNQEATALKNLVQSHFPSDAWVIVAGDMNTSSRTESAIGTFKTFLSDAPVPSDAVSGGDQDTNLNRNKPYDYVLPSFTLTNALTNVTFASHSFPKGLVFDSRVYTPLSDVAPVQLSDSAQGQHMGVVKDFWISVNGTNVIVTGPQITAQPTSLTVTQGSDATFSVTATGEAPLAYQWQFESTDIPDATNVTYMLQDAQFSDAGSYTVVVTNMTGSVTSDAAILIVLPPGGGGTGDVIAQWDFNSVLADGDTTSGTLSPSIGFGTASVVGGINQTFYSGSGSSDPAATDNSALGTSGYPAQGTGNKTAGVQFSVSTVGRENISVAWEAKASKTGSKYARLQYTTNRFTFVDYPASVVNDTSFVGHTNDLSTLPGVADNPNFAIRIVAEFESTATGTGTDGYVGAASSYGTAGTLRYDMVTVYGTTIVTAPPEPATLVDPAYSDTQFQFGLTGQTGGHYVIETATNLNQANWTSVETNIAPFIHSETNVSETPLRFYRARSLPQ